MKTHRMQKKPYMLLWGQYPLYKSLCGIGEPKSQAYGRLPVTCERCMTIMRNKQLPLSEVRKEGQ